MCSELVHIAGRYNKYRRNLSQSPWIVNDDVRIKHSVQELIEEGLKEYLQFSRSIFATSGREDVDVRMLGQGRPFVFKIHDPENETDFNQATLDKIQSYVNNKHGDKIQIRDLQFASKSSVSRHLKEGQESKTKEYRALCCCTRKLFDDDFEKINNLRDLYIDQKTPVRVLHRRTLATRRRKIFSMKINQVERDEFDCCPKEEELDFVFVLNLVTEAGTYIKEFVHGDFGRTEPNLATILGNCDTDLIALDVMGVNLDWPPSLSVDMTEASGGTPNHQPVEMEKSGQALADVYEKALKAMQDASSMPRGDKRQELYIEARKGFEMAIGLVESLALFSDNETSDDITTADLKYLLIPAYLARIILSAECGPNRLKTFSHAKSLLEQFLGIVSQYGLADANIEHILKSSESQTNNQLSGRSIEDAMRERNEKIEKYKRMKALESTLEDLNCRMKSGQEVDDEVAREYYLNLIKKWIDDSAESLEHEVRPAILFEQMGSTSAKPEPETCKIPSASGPSQTITIVKDHLQKQVFGIGYPSRPTVTVDEFISKKINDGDLAFHAQKEIYANSMQRYAEQPNLRREQDEQSEEERDEKEDRDDAEEIARKRRWDEFKDDTPRGSGNRHNMG